MKRISAVVICILLSLLGNAYALNYNDIKMDMSYQEVVPLLSEFELEEKAYESSDSKSITAKKPDTTLYIGFKDNRVSSYSYYKQGKEMTSLDFFEVDWSLTIDDVILMLEKEQGKYEYGTNELYDKSGYNYSFGFNGYLDYIPVEYFMRFNQEGNLTEIIITASMYFQESDYLTILAYMGNRFGKPENVETDEVTTFSDDDKAVEVVDTCNWISNNSIYNVIISTSIDKDDVDEIVYGMINNSISIIIEPIKQ